MSRLIIVLLTAFTLSACAEYDGASEGAPAPEGPNIKSGVEGIRTAAENWWYDTDAYPYTPENLAHWARYQ